MTGPPSGAAVDGLEAAIVGCRAAHRRLFATLDGLGGVSPTRPSRLPDWTVGHVLTHLARNADSHVRMLEGAQRGQTLEQYAGGYAQRAADIAAGAERPTDELGLDVRSSALRLEEAWAAMSAEAWEGHGSARGRPWKCRDMPFHRWREVELHHVDMGLGYEVADWPEDYVARDLPWALDALPGRLGDVGARRRLLAWLLGRADDAGPLPLDDWQ